jgi:hypothetical protein
MTDRLLSAQPTLAPASHSLKRHRDIEGRIITRAFDAELIRGG